MMRRLWYRALFGQTPNPSWNRQRGETIDLHIKNPRLVFFRNSAPLKEQPDIIPDQEPNILTTEELHLTIVATKIFQELKVFI